MLNDQRHAQAFNKNKHSAYNKNKHSAYNLSCICCVSGSVLGSLHALFYLIIMVTSEASPFIYLHFMGVESGFREIPCLTQNHINGGRTAV